MVWWSSGMRNPIQGLKFPNSFGGVFLKDLDLALGFP